jgi:hypothetical protein
MPGPDRAAFLVPPDLDGMLAMSYLVPIPIGGGSCQGGGLTAVDEIRF